MKLRLLVLLLLFSVPNLATAQLIPERAKLFMSAHYLELEQLMETEVKDMPDPPTSKLFYLCLAYEKLKRYNKLFPCLDRMEDHIKNGDIALNDLDEMRKNSPILFGFAMMGSAMVGGESVLKGNATPFLYLLRAEAYTELRDYDKAIANAHLAYDAIPENWTMERSFRIYALTQLGLSNAFAGNEAEARKYAETLQNLSTSYPYSGLTDDKVTGVAKIYIALGDYKKAYDGLRSDSETFMKAFINITKPLTYLVTGGEMAKVSFEYQELPKEFMAVKTDFEVGNVKEARAGYDKLLAIPEVTGNGEIYWVLLYDRGRIAAQDGDHAAAIDYWKKAVEVIEQQRSSINTEANKIGFVGDKQEVYKKLVAMLFQEKRLPEAFDYLERSKSRALVDMLASKENFSVANGDAAKADELLKQADRIELDSRAQDLSAASGVAATSTAAPPKTAGEPAQAEASGIGATSSTQIALASPPNDSEKHQRSLAVVPVKETLAQTAPELLSLVSVTSTPIEKIQDRIGQDEALVEYYYDNSSLYVFVLTREGLQGERQDAAELPETIRQFRDALDRTGSGDYLPLSQKLYDQLIAPIDGMLAGKTKLILVPHGILHYLPFAALNDGKQFLLDKYGLRLLPSASVITYLKGRNTIRQGGLLAFGSPDLGDPKYDLAFAAEEAQAVARDVPHSRVFLHKDATESALQRNAANYSYLHFATHGKFDAAHPLQSAILLAPDQTSNGLLTVNKLYSMTLDADLVTLSACETGLGEIANGDDVVGLTRGFLYAGSRSIVASLWSVDDKATAALMERFYQNMKKMDKESALREAQIDTRQVFPHPYYWAAFQLTGQAN